ncbi:hypothetical protein AVEN_144757-1 [Araneus ventricosus]|uniref:Uncharacterized protein n=1 Tax=Araneus ventricosus TaxID=182803 RepID=A0A4Y2JJQ4_ARAVE|nr:hypothetical protein AVEN_144757-1 [Araneus ventricosus]
MYDLACHRSTYKESGFEPGALRPRSRYLVTKPPRPQGGLKHLPCGAETGRIVGLGPRAQAQSRFMCCGPVAHLNALWVRGGWLPPTSVVPEGDSSGVSSSDRQRFRHEPFKISILLQNR